MPGQVKDTDDNRPTGFDDTICPVDFTEHGQISSEIVRKNPFSARYRRPGLNATDPVPISSCTGRSSHL